MNNTVHIIRTRKRRRKQKEKNIKMSTEVNDAEDRKTRVENQWSQKLAFWKDQQTKRLTNL